MMREIIRSTVQHSAENDLCIKPNKLITNKFKFETDSPKPVKVRRKMCA
jgi:hypothetical protein